MSAVWCCNTKSTGGFLIGGLIGVVIRNRQVDFVLGGLICVVIELTHSSILFHPARELLVVVVAVAAVPYTLAGMRERLTLTALINQIFSHLHLDSTNTLAVFLVYT